MSISPKVVRVVSQSPLPTPRKNLPTLPNLKASTGNQKLKFTKSLNDLTPRSKALFFSLCKSPKKKIEDSKNNPENRNSNKLETWESNLSKNETYSPKIQGNHTNLNLPPLLKKGSNYASRKMSTESPTHIMTNVTNLDLESQGSSALLNPQDQKQLIIAKLTVKEISDVIKGDTVNNGQNEGKINKNYMKDLTKYSTLLGSKINTRSPRTRQALINLSYDPDIFTAFSFEELYNNNMGRMGNVRKFMEYLSGKSNDFINVLNERNRLMRLERDLNKKFINENIISKDFADSIFHVNAYRLSELEMENLYYNYYRSPESRKRLNNSQKKFDKKLLENRTKFITYQKKLDFVVNDIKNLADGQKKYYKSWEDNIKKIEENKKKQIEEKKTKAMEYVEKVKQKNQDFRRKENWKRKELDKKAEELAKSLGEELINRQKIEFERYKERGEKDKQLEAEQLQASMEKYQSLLLEYQEIGERLVDFDKKNEKTFLRKMQMLEEIRKKLQQEQKKTFDRVQRVQTLNDMSEKELIKDVLTRYNKKYERSLSQRSKSQRERIKSAKEREKISLANLKYNKSKLQTQHREKALVLREKFSQDDEKMEKSAELRRRKTQILIEKDQKKETEAKRHAEMEKIKLFEGKKKVIGFHKKIEQRRSIKLIERNMIQSDVMEKHIEGANYREQLLAKSP